MKKQQYVAAVACLVAGAIGFASVYATEKAQERKELAQQEREAQESQNLSATSSEVKPKPGSSVEKPQIAERDPQPQIEEQLPVDEAEEPVEEPVAASVDTENETVPTAAVDELHFEKGIVWPLDGEVLLDYSMDATVYFPTLEQYRYNPAVVIAGAVNDKVSAVARGKIIEIYNSEETGCTVKQELGDGYVAVYGQLKELNFDVGDTIESGQVIGYVSEPTKYYSVEGTNVYFELLKDGEAVNPVDFLPARTMDTLE